MNDVKYSTTEMALHSKLDQQYLKALEGFFLIIAKEGDMMYLSENAAKYLGLTQVSRVISCIYTRLSSPELLPMVAVMLFQQKIS